MAPISTFTFIFILLMSVTIGTGGYTLYYAKGFSYLTDDPKACTNCHVMEPMYNSWQRGSHHAVTVCNDCHTPKNFFNKYLVKA